MIWLTAAYWTRSLCSRDRFQHLASRQVSAADAGGCSDEEAVLDDETRRLLDDSHLLIATQRLLLLDAIGQGPISLTHPISVVREHAFCQFFQIKNVTLYDILNGMPKSC